MSTELPTPLFCYNHPLLKPACDAITVRNRSVQNAQSSLPPVTDVKIACGLSRKYLKLLFGMITRWPLLWRQSWLLRAVISLLSLVSSQFLSLQSLV